MTAELFSPRRSVRATARRFCVRAAPFNQLGPGSRSAVPGPWFAHDRRPRHPSDPAYLSKRSSTPRSMWIELPTSSTAAAPPRGRRHRTRSRVMVNTPRCQTHGSDTTAARERPVNAADCLRPKLCIPGICGTQISGASTASVARRALDLARRHHTLARHRIVRPRHTADRRDPGQARRALSRDAENDTRRQCGDRKSTARPLAIDQMEQKTAAARL